MWQYGGAVVSTVVTKQEGSGCEPTRWLDPFCMELSPMGSPWVLRLPPAAQRHAG